MTEPARRAPTEQTIQTGTGREVERRLGLIPRLALVFTGTSGIWLLIVYLNTTVFAGDTTTGVRLLNAALTCLLAVTLIVASRQQLDHRRLDGLGLALNRDAWTPFAAGLAAFTVPSFLGFTFATLTGQIQLTLLASGADLAASMALLVVTVFFYEALPEELIFRGYLYRNLATVVAPWLAALVQAALFALFGTSLWVLTHGWDVLTERGILFLCVGLVLGVIRVVSGSVWTCIGFHLGFQVTAQTLSEPNVITHGPIELFGIAPSFLLGTALVAVTLRRSTNWTRSEPDLPVQKECTTATAATRETGAATTTSSAWSWGHARDSRH